MSAIEWIGFAALIVMVAVLTGCSSRMQADEARWAIEACSSKGGLTAIERSAARGWSYIAAECKNGESVGRRFDR